MKPLLPLPMFNGEISLKSHFPSLVRLIKSMLRLCACLVVLALSHAFVLLPELKHWGRLGNDERGRLKMGVGTDMSKVGTENLDWPNLGFEYRQTRSFVQCEYKDGKWGKLRLETDPYIKVHIGGTALHYGQACFEGLKAFQCKDKAVRIFRPHENAARIARSCERVCMPPIPADTFIEACKMAVKDNLEFVPPYGTNGALYIRPVLFGSGPRIGLQPSDEYIFVVLVIPVADYYKGGLKPVPAVVIDGYDRAAPRGVGNVKVAGNYASDLLPNVAAKKAGYPIGLYLDAKSNSYVEEFSTSNFLAIDDKGAYVTPKSDAILESITNKSLMELAKDEGLDVQVRPVKVDEISSGKFKEVAACGTAVVVTPINKVLYKDNLYSIGEPGATTVGPTIKRLYDRVRSIQNGEVVFKNWMVDV